MRARFASKAVGKRPKVTMEIMLWRLVAVKLLVKTDSQIYSFYFYIFPV